MKTSWSTLATCIIFMAALLMAACVPAQKKQGQSFDSYYNTLLAGKKSKDINKQIKALKKSAATNNGNVKLTVIHIRLSELLANPRNPKPDCNGAIEELILSLNHSLKANWSRTDINAYLKRLVKAESSIKNACENQSRKTAGDLVDKLQKCEDNLIRLQDLELQMEKKKRRVR
jgi:hypothetical protein